MSPEFFGDMAPDTSTYQAFKLWLGTILPVNRNLLHVVLGGLLLIAALLVPPRSHAPSRALGAAVLLGIGMEALDRRDDLADLGAWRVGESLKDVARTIAVPLFALVLVRVRRARSRVT
ncbi:hypothetical protein [Roseobacter sinensis]|uniref:VanZ-like domain-containing protein n=1 Tax=Roseobacter sinensis TaxID=2931391 RepID=A0ABT3BH54_9RHOB|nr:hypothetical protein [Roseobacter sp. WL0113]MCV3272898.1 hypothetical protein [Roseobacter sp. WL0113]